MKKKTSVHVFRESTIEAQKRNRFEESSLVFERERETCEKEDEKSHRFHISSFQKFKRERRERPQHQDIIIIIIIIATQTRAVNKERERKKEHVQNRIPGDGVKFHKLLASPTFGPCSAIIMLCNESSFYEENFMSKTRERGETREILRVEFNWLLSHRTSSHKEEEKKSNV